MKKKILPVAVAALMMVSCASSSSSDNSLDDKDLADQSVDQNQDNSNYKIQSVMSLDKLADELVAGYDMNHLSYVHGFLTAKQLKNENFTFLDINKVFELVKGYHGNTLTPLDKQVSYANFQRIAQASNNFENIQEEDKGIIHESLISLYYSMFINDASFAKLNLDQFEKGLFEFWNKNEVANEDELIQDYVQFKQFFSESLGANFLADNKNRDGVNVTASGLQYEILKEGDGAKPSEESNVTVHYHGELLDGTIFDSSYQRGETISFGLNQVIKGWTEGLQLMNTGAKYRFFIPYNLAYGEQGNQGIPPYATLIFDVELFSFE